MKKGARKMKGNHILAGAKGKYIAVKYEMSKDLEIDISSLIEDQKGAVDISEDKDMQEKLKELYEK